MKLLQILTIRPKEPKIWVCIVDLLKQKQKTKDKNQRTVQKGS